MKLSWKHKITHGLFFWAWAPILKKNRHAADYIIASLLKLRLDHPKETPGLQGKYRLN